MLSRPGEAIYNDANGAPEGNHFFQVVWLSEERREAYLKAVARAWRQSGKPMLARTPIVFEGDAPAELARNPLLRAAARRHGLARVAAVGAGLGGRRDLDQGSHPRPSSAARAETTC